MLAIESTYDRFPAMVELILRDSIAVASAFRRLWERIVYLWRKFSPRNFPMDPW